MLKDAATLSWPGLAKHVLPSRDTFEDSVKLTFPEKMQRTMVTTNQPQKTLFLNEKASVEVAAASPQV